MFLIKYLFNNMKESKDVPIGGKLDLTKMISIYSEIDNKNEIETPKFIYTYENNSSRYAQ